MSYSIDGLRSIHGISNVEANFDVAVYLPAALISAFREVCENFIQAPPLHVTNALHNLAEATRAGQIGTCLRKSEYVCQKNFGSLKTRANRVRLESGTKRDIGLFQSSAVAAPPIGGLPSPRLTSKTLRFRRDRHAIVPLLPIPLHQTLMNLDQPVKDGP
jgi:hypothetical protein